MKKLFVVFALVLLFSSCSSESPIFTAYECSANYELYADDACGSTYTEPKKEPELLMPATTSREALDRGRARATASEDYLFPLETLFGRWEVELVHYDYLGSDFDDAIYRIQELRM